MCCSSELIFRCLCCSCFTVLAAATLVLPSRNLGCENWIWKCSHRLRMCWEMWWYVCNRPNKLDQIKSLISASYTHFSILYTLHACIFLLTLQVHQIPKQVTYFQWLIPLFKHRCLLRSEMQSPAAKPEGYRPPQGYCSVSISALWWLRYLSASQVTFMPVYLHIQKTKEESKDLNSFHLILAAYNQSSKAS